MTSSEKIVMLKREDNSSILFVAASTATNFSDEVKNNIRHLTFNLFYNCFRYSLFMYMEA
jgi:hypothetical protein